MKRKLFIFLMLIGIFSFVFSCVTEVGNPEKQMESTDHSEANNAKDPAPSSESTSKEHNNPQENNNSEIDKILIVARLPKESEESEYRDSQKSINTLKITNFNNQNVGLVNFSRILICLKNIKLFVSSNNEGNLEQREIPIAGPFLLDLLKNEISPMPLDIHLGPGEITGIELQFHIPTESDGEIIERLKKDHVENSSIFNSILIEGNYEKPFEEKSIISIPFTLNDNTEELIKVKSLQDSKSNNLRDEFNNYLFIEFQMEDWLSFNDMNTNSSQFDIGSFLKNTNYRINISPTNPKSNIREISRIIKENIIKSIFFRISSKPEITGDNSSKEHSYAIDD